MSEGVLRRVNRPKIRACCTVVHSHRKAERDSTQVYRRRWHLSHPDLRWLDLHYFHRRP